jgi:hypothetical protein
VAEDRNAPHAAASSDETASRTEGDVNENDRIKTANAAIEALTIIADSLHDTECVYERGKVRLNWTTPRKEAFVSAVRGVASSLQEAFGKP